MTPKKIFDVQIAGMKLKLKTSHSEEVVNQLVDFVNKKIEDSLILTKSGSLQNASILAALNIAEEMFVLKKNAFNKLDQLESKMGRLSVQMESSQISRLGIDDTI